MKKFLVAIVFLICCNINYAQKINGQWRGYFNSKGDIVLTGGDNTEFVLEIEVNGTKVTGFSYSYFLNRKYYVICSLNGTYDKGSKSMKVTETARIKGLTPPDWNDCLQTHVLTYLKKDGEEELTGQWVTAPGQVSNCGMGKTTLRRRTLSKDLSSFNKAKTPNDNAVTKTTIKIPPVTENKVKKPVAPPIVKTVEKPKTKAATEQPLAKTKPVERDSPEIIVPEVKKQNTPIGTPVIDFEKRNSEILKTIEIDSATFKVDLYDNGEIDGDIISLFYNGKLLLSKKTLSEKPITLILDAGNGKTINELVMYAENLGLYPPNTALMIVTDGNKRYEVRISSDLKKSGTIRFVHRSNQLSPKIGN